MKSVKGKQYPTVHGREDETGMWDKEPGSWRWVLDHPLGSRILEGVLPSEYPEIPGLKTSWKHQMCHCRVEFGIQGRNNANGNPVWGWDGNESNPTLDGSILTETTWGPKNIPVRWHGYMRAGNFEACE